MFITYMFLLILRKVENTVDQEVALKVFNELVKNVNAINISGVVKKHIMMLRLVVLKA